MNFNPCHAESNKIFHKSCERWKDQLYNQLTTTKKKIQRREKWFRDSEEVNLPQPNKGHADKQMAMPFILISTIYVYIAGQR